MPPLFLTFEGLDGSGKSTHLRRAAEWLEARGQSCRQTREPGGTELGQGIRDLFLDPRWGEMDGTVELLLVFASRRQHLVEVIEPALAAGQHVLCDRFTDSTVAYQGFGRGVSLDTIDAVDRLATGGRSPDHTLLLDLPAKEAWERGRSHSRRSRPGGVDRLDGESREFYQRVRDGYHHLAERHPGRITVISSAGPRERTWSAVERCLEQLFPELEAPSTPTAGEPPRPGTAPAGGERS